MTDDAQRLEHIQRISARDGLTSQQKRIGILLGGGIAVCLAWDPLSTLAWIVQICIIGFTAIVVFKTYAYLKHGNGMAELPSLLPLDECPAYTALVPCYREGKVLGQLVERLAELEYPKDRLRILLLLEADDDETLAEVDRLSLPAFIEPVVVPLSWMPNLRGKPRALMYAVRHGMVTGDYCVIWDAEDIVERDQLRKAATAFRRYPEIACFQAELRWWNANQNWLTRMMAAAYAHHFALMMPGLCATHSVVPLGGTSNHLRVSALEMVNWWDPYNVTEDLDLGVKLRRAGQRVMLLPSITWEEATGTFGQQRNQMSRWVKGHSATAFAHLRHPVALVRDLGFKGTLSFVSVVMAAHPASLAAPIFWAVTATYIATGSGIIRQITPFAAFYLGLICFAANFLFVLASMLAILRTRQYRLWPWLFLLPIHWATVGCAASFKAAKEIATGRLYFWDKTPRTHLFADAGTRLGGPAPGVVRESAPHGLVVARVAVAASSTGEPT